MNHCVFVILWAVFACIFGFLSFYHWRVASKSIAYLQVEQSKPPAGVKFSIGLGGIDFMDFVDKFNRYIDYYNESSRKQNKFQAGGYLVACATAIVSLVITLLGNA